MPQSVKYQLRVTPIMDGFIQSMIQTGKFDGAQAFIVSAIERECDRQRAIHQLDEAIASGLQDIKKSRIMDGDSFFEALLKSPQNATPDSPSARRVKSKSKASFPAKNAKSQRMANRAASKART
jgi:Arc/MetJ-type ribon-helix-helix transcriptional regulator